MSMENGTVSGEIVHQLTVLIQDKACAVWRVKVSLQGCLCVNGEWDCVGRDCPLANCPNPGQAVLSVKISLQGCLFVNGEWDCVRRDCPPTNCPNPGCPGQGIWCMECEDKLTGVFICQWRMGLCQERLSTN